jgi:hypothetical protein
MEDAIRKAVASLKPGDVFTAAQLAPRLDLDEKAIGIWLDVLVGEGKLVPEHSVLSDIHPGEHVTRYRIPPNS